MIYQSALFAHAGHQHKSPQSAPSDEAPLTQTQSSPTKASSTTAPLSLPKPQETSYGYSEFLLITILIGPIVLYLVRLLIHRVTL